MRKKGLEIKAQNYRCRMGEIDLIARDGPYLVFVEVKYRSDSRRGGALAAVTRKKQQVIGRVAQNYLLRYHGRVDLPCRFDVIGIEGEKIYWIKDAFDSVSR